jgi:hypothetical protein
LKCLPLTANPTCNGAILFGNKIYNTLKGKLEKVAPCLNKASISLRLLSFSSFLNVNRCSMIISFYKYLLIVEHAISINGKITNKKKSRD